MTSQNKINQKNSLDPTPTSNGKRIWEIKQKLNFLLYKQGNTYMHYRNVYTNRNGAMYYSMGVKGKSDPYNGSITILINNIWQKFQTGDAFSPQHITDKEIGPGVSRHPGVPLYFDTIYLNNDNSFSFRHRDINTSFEFDENFQTRPHSGGKRLINYTQNLAKLPNGMTVQFDSDYPLVRTLMDPSGQKVLNNIKYIQKLSPTEIIIWQDAPHDDIYIVDLTAKLKHYEAALAEAGLNEVYQKRVDDYKTRYLQVVNAFLGPQNQK